jgi:predicted ArsR family transcriptional regulator
MADRVLLDEGFNSKVYLTPIQHSLVKTLQKNGPLSRRELVRELETPRTTIYDNLLKLQKNKLIEKFSRNNGKRGRPLVFWKLKE